MIPCEWLMCIHNNNSGGKGRKQRGEDQISFDSNLLDQQGCVANLSEHLKFSDPSLLSSMSNYRKHQCFRIKVHCVQADFSLFFCHLQPPPAPAYLRSSILRNEGEGGTWCPLCQGVRLVPPANAGTTPGGINFLPLAEPMLSFCHPSRPPSIHRSQGQWGYVSSFLSCVLAVFPLRAGCAHSGSCNHTHTSKSLSMATNVAHLSNRLKAH